MQLSILVGFLLSFGSLLIAILFESNFNYLAIMSFFNLPAMIIIFGGITGVIIVAFPWDHLKEIPSTLQKAFAEFEDMDIVKMAMEMRSLALKSRQSGVLSLESDVPTIKDDWMRRGVSMVIDGIDRELVRNVLEQELSEFERKSNIGATIFTQLGGYAPTLGIIGTIMGLVNMLAEMDDPTKLGSAISVAFLATFWGILSANLIFLPIAERAKVKNKSMALTRQAMIEAIMCLHAGESVRILNEKMKLFMDPEDAKRFEFERYGSVG